MFSLRQTLYLIRCYIKISLNQFIIKLKNNISLKILNRCNIKSYFHERAFLSQVHKTKI